MPAMCQAIPSPETFAPGMIAFLDCQAQSLGAQGYQALAAPGSSASILLTGMITLLIAVIGYRMLLGYVPSVRDGVLTFVKIGVVFVLASSWPAYQVIIYDVILRSPAEFAASIGGASGLPGMTGGLATRLDGIDQGLKAIAIAGVGSPPIGSDGVARLPDVAPSPFLGFDSFALGWSRVGFLVSTLASLALVRIVAGLLLALGPLFAGFLLFEGTRGLFEGWLRALIGSALAALAISIVLGVELAFLEPWLATLLARRAADLDIIGSPAQLFATTLIFGVALFAIVFVISRVANGLRLPGSGRDEASTYNRVPSPDLNTLVSSPGGPALESRSRAAAVADAIAVHQRREEQGVSMSGTAVGNVDRSLAALRPRSDVAQSAAVQRTTSARRIGYRVSARSATRDRLK